jgi:hypothetical protein
MNYLNELTLGFGLKPSRATPSVIVAQTGSLLCRRLATCELFVAAGCQPATQQVANLRYGAWSPSGCQPHVH